MDFNYSQEQYLMQDSALALFREIGGPPAARRAYAEGAGVARTLLPPLAEQGLLGGPLSGDFGGSELSVLDFALVFEAAGRTLLPFPDGRDVRGRHGLERAGERRAEAPSRREHQRRADPRQRGLGRHR